MNGTVEIVPSVTDAFAHRVHDILARPRSDGFSLFLSGGTTAGQAYQRLAETSATGVDWSTVDVYWGDERCVSLDDADSNYRLCHQTLLDRVGPVRSEHPMYRSGEPGDAAAEYQRLLEGVPRYDLIHLGMGPDGHTASLFPESKALAIEDPDILVVANRDPLGHNLHDRITLTLPAIRRARLVVFTVDGASKREAFARVMAGDDLPAGRVSADEVIWLVDPDAAGDLVVP
ncbi:MAG TPA: 6-phosphogluconolactonase [Acidimicrobiales bacterium]|jgi:6-phosphogluconolactonase|nr:6-phosphogluconolactonase [Acidimicrobiales bacterium]